MKPQQPVSIREVLRVPQWRSRVETSESLIDGEERWAARHMHAVRNFLYGRSGQQKAVEGERGGDGRSIRESQEKDCRARAPSRRGSLIGWTNRPEASTLPPSSAWPAPR